MVPGGVLLYNLKIKLKSPFIFTKKCPDRHKNHDYWYLLNKYSPKTQNFDIFFTS